MDESKEDPVIPVETPEVGVDQLAQAVKYGAAILDVREAYEYAAGQVPGGVLLPMGQVPRRMAELDRGAPAYVVCASGNRSATMTGLLRNVGFDACPVAGGTSGWSRSGRPVVGGNALRA